MVDAVHGLGSRLGVEIEVVFAVELGGINTPAPMSAAMDMGATLADASCSDRSIPELDQIPAIAAGRGMAPASVADTWGNRIVVEAAPSVRAAEHLVKSLSVTPLRRRPRRPRVAAGCCSRARSSSATGRTRAAT
jgi:DUF917 family protein